MAGLVVTVLDWREIDVYQRLRYFIGVVGIGGIDGKDDLYGRRALDGGVGEGLEGYKGKKGDCDRENGRLGWF